MRTYFCQPFVYELGQIEGFGRRKENVHFYSRLFFMLNGKYKIAGMRPVYF